MVRKGTTAKLASPITLDADDQQTLREVVGFYHETLKDSPEALRYLESRGLTHPEMIGRFKLGFANRTLGLTLPDKNRKAGAELRGRLQRLGILRAESGHEHFNGSVVFPIFSLEGDVLGMYGRKITAEPAGGHAAASLPAGAAPRRVERRGAGRLEGNHPVRIDHRRADVLVRGFRNVTASYGVNGFTDDHRAAFQKHGVQQVWIAYDRDEAGDAAAERLKEELLAARHRFASRAVSERHGRQRIRVKVTPASQSLAVLLNRAEWRRKRRLPLQPVIPLAADPEVDVHGDEIIIPRGDRRYRIRGLAKNLSHELMKVNVLVSRQEEFHVDTLDLHTARQRAAFIKRAAEELGVKEDVIRKDLGRVLLKLEELQAEQIRKALEPAKPEVTISDEEREAALALLKEPKLLDRIWRTSTAAAWWARRPTSSSAIWPPCRGIWNRRWPWWCSRPRPPARARSWMRCWRSCRKKSASSSRR